MANHDQQKMIDAIDARFVSGNSVPIERTHITSSEWDRMRPAVQKAELAAIREELLVKALSEGPE
jgi:hypothetical protein